MKKGLKIRLYPNEDHLDYISRLLGTSRFIYNKCLNYKVDEYEKNKRRISWKDLGQYLVGLKSEHIWIKDVHSKVLQQSIMNLNSAYSNYFRKLRTGEVEKEKNRLIKEYKQKGKEINWKKVNNICKPKFKSKHDIEQTCRFPIDAISGVRGNRIDIISKLSDIHFKCSSKDERYLNRHQDKISSATLKMTKSGKYILSVLIDRPNKVLSKPINDIIGIDMGINNFVISSEGALFENLKIKRSNEKRLALLHKELSRKVEGSQNRDKSRVKLSKLYEKLNNKKNHYLHHVVNQLLSENQTIVIENLSVTNLLKNHKLARAIQELSLSEFKIILKYKGLWYGRDIIEVDRWFPSSKLCSCCGFKNDNLKLSDRTWVCPDCGVSHDRDINAAVNIKNEGQRLIKIGMSLPELTPMESSPQGSRRSRKQQVGCIESCAL
jgi:putative transposase